MNKKRTLIAGSVGLVALGTIALTQAQKRRQAASRASTGGEAGQSAMDPEATVIEMPAAGETFRPESMDPVIE